MNPILDSVQFLFGPRSSFKHEPNGKCQFKGNRSLSTIRETCSTVRYTSLRHGVGKPVLVRSLVNWLAKRESSMARRLCRMALIVASMALPGCFQLAWAWQFRDECRTDADCDDGIWCNGEEVCYLCDEGDWCFGKAICESSLPQWCQGEVGPLSMLCNEETRQCEVGDECELDADCSDGIFCNGDEVCIHGLCFSGELPCFPPAPVCNEEARQCEVGDECEIAADCADGLFCNGDESCAFGLCFSGRVPCLAPVSICNEAEGRCVPNTTGP